MNKNITLTIDELRVIREEHSARTKNLPNDEYRKYLEEEAAPIRLAIERAKAHCVGADNL